MASLCWDRQLALLTLWECKQRDVPSGFFRYIEWHRFIKYRSNKNNNWHSALVTRGLIARLSKCYRILNLVIYEKRRVLPFSYPFCLGCFIYATEHMTWNIWEKDNTNIIKKESMINVRWNNNPFWDKWLAFFLLRSAFRHCDKMPDVTTL